MGLDMYANAVNAKALESKSDVDFELTEEEAKGKAHVIEFSPALLIAEIENDN